jgi:predicted nucleotidyltransferase
MNTQNLEKLPVNAQNLLKPYLDEFFKIYGGDIVSVFVYGSVTGPDFNPKTSDINLAVVLKEVSVEKLKSVLKTVRQGMRRKITAPLFLSPAYIKMSLDTFPMEFMSMKDSRLLLFGDDVLSDIAVKKADLRRECEYQLKGKLLTIRQAYLEQAMDRKGLERLIKSSFRALLPVFQNVLRIEREEAPPADKEEVLCQLSEEFDVDVSSFLEILGDKKTDGKIGGKPLEEFLNDFLTQLERVTDAVDHMEVQD